MRSILEIYLEGQTRKLASEVLTESAKVGTLRAGNTGVMTGKGEVVGACHRKTWLRMKGIQGYDPVTFSKSLMFSAGVNNEDLWVEVLEAANEQGLVIKRESDIPINWNTSNGVSVTGRPDVVLGRDHPSEVVTFKTDIGDVFESPRFVPEVGLELKLVSSLWTARDVLFKGKPKVAHLMQAGHYAYQLGIPFELWYSCRTNFAITDYSESRFFAAKNFPKQGRPLSEYCSYNEKGQILNVEPFIHGYQIRWNDKVQLEYRAVNEEKWTQTFITWKGINAYYEYIASMEKDDTLGPRPSNVEADGTDGGFDICSPRYCPLAYTCDNAEKNGLAAWKDKVVEAIAGMESATKTEKNG